MTDPNYIFNNVVALLAGLGVLALVFFGIRAMRKKYPGQDYGQLIATHAVDKNEQYFILFIILIYIAEALVASTVHAPNEGAPNPLARTISHIAINLIGTFAQITLVRDFAVLFLKMPKKERAIKIIVALFVAMIAMIVPYANLLLISSGMGQYQDFLLWTAHMLPWTTTDKWQNALIALDLPANYNPFAQFQTQLKTTVFLTVLDYLITILEGARNISSPARRRMLLASFRKELAEEAIIKRNEAVDKPKEGGANDPMPGSTRDPKKIEENISILLSRIGYKEQQKRNTMVKLCNESLQRVKDNDMRMKLAAKISGLKIEAAQADAMDDNNPEKSTTKAELKARIKAFFMAKNEGPIETRGLGVKVSDTIDTDAGN